MNLINTIAQEIDLKYTSNDRKGSVDLLELGNIQEKEWKVNKIYPAGTTSPSWTKSFLILPLTVHFNFGCKWKPFGSSEWSNFSYRARTVLSLTSWPSVTRHFVSFAENEDEIITLFSSLSAILFFRFRASHSENFDDGGGGLYNTPGRVYWKKFW